ncbi:DUF4160 domain-containing protein [Arcicella sp. LKC2W]|uniref:DUF4160 domain-containing protein n=1 Tax=Arcicella sp. LKC2W TaxID=2984198 RepID=UPI002B1F084F|nr:DUF4160 domain-containing protein [Arcicella sp. LKC2W]MEA5459012.1 DUF4160 domain-containing protein [Arcicella sp. LKC2W]
MPVIELFEGIKILMFANDHNPPHFHVYYASFKAMIEISSLQIIRGELPNKQYHKVVEWAELRQQELLEDFINLNPQLRK